MAKSKVSLKLLIDKSRNKVLFAEADKDFVDFLFNLLSMPIGTVTRLLTKKSMVGSMGNLYGSIENLSNNYLQTQQTKESLLKPKLPLSALEVPLSLTNAGDDDDENWASTKLYQCQNARNCSSYRCTRNATDHPNACCPSCKTLMNQDMVYVAPSVRASEVATSKSEGVGFVKGLVTFMVSDDLVVTPSAAISSITKVIKEVGVQGLDKIEERVVRLGMDQGLMLLKESLQSDTVLSNVFLKPTLSETKTSSSKKNKKRKHFY